MKNQTTNSIKFTSMLFLFVFIITGCDGLSSKEVLQGDGNVNQYVFETEPFHEIEIKGVFNVLLTQGNEQEVFLDIDSNLFDQISIEVQNETLIVGVNRENFVRPTRINLHITYTDLDRISASGASKIFASNPVNTESLHISLSGATDINLEMNVKELTTSVSGASNVNFSGKATDHFAEMSGAGSFQAENLITEFTKVSLSGAGVIYVHAKQKLEATVSGVGNVYYAGNPEEKRFTRRGIGVIRQL